MGSAALSQEEGEYDPELWRVFANPHSKEEFCQAWLAVLCRQLGGVHAGLVLLGSAESNSYLPAALWPDVQRDLSYLAATAERALTERRGVTHRPVVSAASSTGVQISYPIEISGELKGAVVLDVTPRGEAELRALLRQLHWGMAWLYDLFQRDSSTQEQAKSKRIGSVMEVVATALRDRKLQQALFEAVNEIADRLGCSRVALGLERKGPLAMAAISRAAWLEKNARMVRLCVAAMEETRDRGTTVVFPELTEAGVLPAPAHAELAQISTAGAELSVPLCRGSECIGILLLERPQGQTSSADDVEWVETLATLLPQIIDLKRRSERSFLGYLWDDLAALGTRLFGPKHLTWKAVGLVLTLTAVLLALVKMDYRVAAKTVIEGEVQRAAVAPFDGFVGQSFVRAGDTVRKGQALCVLDDRDLRLEQARWSSERDQYMQKYREALATRDLPATQVLQAQIHQAEAQLALVDERLSRTQIIAPFDGIVVSGDLSQMVGAPVELGKKLFEITPLDRYRVILQVDEREIRRVRLGQRGKLVIAGISGDPMPFKVKKVTPVASVADGRNFFRVEAQLEVDKANLRPGMEGVGKIKVGKRRLWWIVTHTFNDWLRLSLWSWLP